MNNRDFLEKIKELKPVNYIISGVYILFQDNDVIYIGRSKNINVRLGQHWQKGKKRWNGLQIIEEHDINKQLLIEKELIRKYLPLLNNCPMSKKLKEGKYYG